MVPQSPPNGNRGNGHIDDSRIKLCSTTLLKLRNDDLQAQTLSIWTIGSHRIDCVGNQNDARSERNGRPGDAVRVSLTIPSLMVVANCVLNRASELRNDADELSTLGSVSLHERCLFIGESRLLAKQRRELLVNLADIMQESGGLYLFDLLGRQSSSRAIARESSRTRSE